MDYLQRIILSVEEQEENIQMDVQSQEDIMTGLDEIRVVEAVSPQINTEREEDGVLITIHDVNGTKTAKVEDGKDYVLTEDDKNEIAGIAENNFSETVRGYKDTAVQKAAEAAASQAATQQIADSVSENTDITLQAAENAAQSAKDAEDAKDDAITARNEASTFSSSAGSFSSNAAQSAQDAHLSQLAAEQAQTSAESALQSTNLAKNAAVTAQGLAETAQVAAEDARDDAQTAAENAIAAQTQAQGYAEDAQDAADTASGHSNTASTYAQQAQQSSVSAANSATSAADSYTQTQTAGTSFLQQMETTRSQIISEANTIATETRAYADSLIAGLGSYLTLKGTKASENEVKSVATAKIGDVYINSADGSEWVCIKTISAADATAWEKLGYGVDLSGYSTTQQIADTYAPKVSPVFTGDGSFSGDVYANNKKLANIEQLENVADIIPTYVSELENDSGYLTAQDIAGKANSNDLAAVATSGNYNDLTNKPSIPTKVSDLTDDSGHYTKPVGGIPASDLAAGVIPDVPVTDVQVNGTSILSNGVANIPKASNTVAGVLKTATTYGTAVQDGIVYLVRAISSQIKDGAAYYNPIVPNLQHESVFYGLAKAAGADEKNSTLSVGTYTETAKSAIRTMLGAASTNIVAVQDEQPTDTDTKVWLPGTQAAGIQVPTMEDMENYVQKTDIASSTDAGIVKVSSNLGVCFYQGTNYLGIQPATTQYIKDGTTSLYPIAPNTAHSVAFYGLAKAAGDTTQSQSDNAVGTYTADASAAIRNMLGAVGDVQVDSTSVISNGIANIPKANPSSGAPGVVGIINYEAGLKIADNGRLSVVTADATDIKTGTNLYRTLTPGRQYASTFYGLAKAAGDTTQSASSNAVGTYTAEAKSAIQSMLGIDLQSIASEVEIPLVETVSGTTPTISGQPNTRYVCGEVSTLSITPPSAGSIDVIFDSGSTPAVITVPNTVRWPAWFDATALEADTTYEILITDGVYGSVMTWAN